MVELKGALTNLGKYNEGELVFEWIEFPCYEDDFEEACKRIGVDGVNYEETFWSDWECDIPGVTKDLGEYESLDDINDLAETLENIDDEEKAGAIIEAFGVSALDNYDDYSYVSKSTAGYTDEDFGYYIIEDIYGNIEELDKDTLERYFDYEAFGRDAKYDYTETDDGYLLDY